MPFWGWKEYAKVSHACEPKKAHPHGHLTIKLLLDKKSKYNKK